MKKGDLKRERILDTAERLFFENGYDRTGVQEILDALQMSKGGFYHYFDAKESLLKEICERRWSRRFERARVELYSPGVGPTDKLNLLLGLTNLFENEDAHFAALMLKIYCRDMDAAIRDHRRRVLLDHLTDPLTEVVGEGIESGILHTRHPLEAGRLALMLACDVNDEACRILAAGPENPDRIIRMIEMLNACRESVELIVGAPYGSVSIFDPSRMVGAWRQASEELKRLEE